MTDIPLMAPNMQSQVQATIDAHPEIDTMNEEERGEIIDITDWRVNGGIETPWGRKARNNDPNNPNLNTDAMTYLRPDGLFEIYDCISGIDGQSSWEAYGPYAPGENGYWWPPQPVNGETPVPPPNEDKDAEQDARLTNLEETVASLVDANSVLVERCNMQDERIAALEARINEPVRAYGPVDLPIVVESLTRMRAKGDIDVQVVPGTAVPPPVSDESWDLLDWKILKRILNRNDPPDK